jgi:hypothetical protein
MESDEEDDLGIFEAEDIQSILHQMNYEIEFIPYGVSSERLQWHSY